MKVSESQAQPPKAPELKPCAHCNAVPKAEQAANAQAWVAVVIHKTRCFWAKWRSDTRQIILQAGFEAWNTRADLPRAAADDRSANEKAVALVYEFTDNISPLRLYAKEWLINRVTELLAATPRAAANYKQGLLDALALAEDHWNKYRDNKAECAVHIIDEIKKAVAATPHAQTGLTVEAWQPIETAPHDGTPILIAFPNGHVQQHVLKPAHVKAIWFPNGEEPICWTPMPKAPTWAKSRAAAETGNET